MLNIKIITENEELGVICKMYWEINSDFDFVYKVEELAELANIGKAKLPGAIRDACNAYIPEWKCKDCGKPYVFSGRSDFLKNRSLLNNSSNCQCSYVCHECNQIRREKEIQEKREKEEAAKKAREIQNNEIRKKIAQTYDLSKRNPINLQELTLTDVIYLMSILRGGAYENLTKIKPVLMFDQPISSDDDFTAEILSHLIDRKLISVHPDSDTKDFVDNNIFRFYIYRVYYAPPISMSALNDPKALVTELQNCINQDWSDDWCQEALQIWKKVALAECKEYLLFVLNEHHFEFSPGEKTIQYFEYALEQFSTAQVFNIIWRAVKDAAAYYLREDISKRHAANAAISSILRYSEKAIAENWDIKPFRRNYKNTQSVISEVLYNSALKLSSDGFQLVPSIETIHTRKLDVSDQTTD